MKTKAQIIDETMEAYLPETRGEHVRALSVGACVIQNNDGHCCAVGRCMTDWAKEYYILSSGPAIGGTNPERVANLLEKALRDEYQGHPTTFWVDLQKFHDTDRLWASEDIAKDYALELHKKWDDK